MRLFFIFLISFLPITAFGHGYLRGSSKDLYVENMPAEDIKSVGHGYLRSSSKNLYTEDMSAEDIKSFAMHSSARKIAVEDPLDEELSDKELSDEELSNEKLSSEDQSKKLNLLRAQYLLYSAMIDKTRQLLYSAMIDKTRQRLLSLAGYTSYDNNEAASSDDEKYHSLVKMAVMLPWIVYFYTQFSKNSSSDKQEL